MRNILFVIGTRPEAIKLAPVIQVFRESGNFNVGVCVTAQHREMLDQVLEFFKIIPDFDLDLMKPNQSLSGLFSRAIIGLENVYSKFKPDIVFVQGDTTTVLVASVAASYNNIIVAHVEAGLRSFDKSNPFPEEINRVLTSHISKYHFAPTKKAVENLRNEGINNNVYNVGNSVIDALFLGLSYVEDNQLVKELGDRVDFSKKIVLLTCHRRESFGAPMENIFKSISSLAVKYQDVQFVFPVHLNPNVKDLAENCFNNENIILIPPLQYPEFIWLMNKSYFVLTDSGGVQEEAPSLKKPVLVLRSVTERTEGVEAGNAILVGNDTNKISIYASRLIEEKEFYQSMTMSPNPYGDGNTAKKILEIIRKEFSIHK